MPYCLFSSAKSVFALTWRGLVPFHTAILYQVTSDTICREHFIRPGPGLRPLLEEEDGHYINHLSLSYLFFSLLFCFKEIATGAELQLVGISQKYHLTIAGKHTAVPKKSFFTRCSVLKLIQSRDMKQQIRLPSFIQICDFLLPARCSQMQMTVLY